MFHGRLSEPWRPPMPTVRSLGLLMGEGSLVQKKRRMQLVLEKRTERSNTIALVSPVDRDRV